MKKLKTLGLLLSSALILGTVTTIFAEDGTQLENQTDTTTPLASESQPPAGQVPPTDDETLPNSEDNGNSSEDGDNDNGDTPPITGGDELTIPGEDDDSVDDGLEDEEADEGGGAEETTEEDAGTEEVTEEDTGTGTEETPAPTVPAPSPAAPTYTAPIPTITQSPSTNTPSEIRVVPTEPTTPRISTEETGVEEEEEINLLEGHYIVYNWNIFTSEEEAQELIDLIEEDEEAQGQLVYELEEISENFFLVRVSYDENADPQGKWVLFYVATMFNTPEEAQEYMEYNLNIYPDIFFAGEVIEVGEYYNVIFGIRVSADTQAVTYDEESFEIDYLEDRQEFTYTVRADEETGEFIDPIPEAVEEAFPGEFTFAEEQISDTEMEVTMTPVESDEEETTQEDAEIELDTEVEETTEEDSAE